MLPLKLFAIIFLITSINCDLTFRNVVLNCESEEAFSTTITTNRLKDHIPSDQKCFRISIEYANIPVLRQNSLSDLNNNAHFLFLENNNIEEVEKGVFSNSRILEAVSLKSNSIREIRRNVFNDLQVPILILSFNYINYIDYQAFDNMTKLERIYLDHNKLTRFDTFWFGKTPKLNLIDLEWNYIEDLPASAFHNEIFTELNFGHNLIQRISPEAFKNTKKIFSLNLSHNKIENLERNLLKDIKIGVLDLNSNKVRCLQFGLARPYGTNLVDHNPWDCNCLKNLKQKEFQFFGAILAPRDFARCNVFKIQ